MTNIPQEYKLTDEEKLACSLISKYPFKNIKDVIEETEYAVLAKAMPLIEKAKKEGYKLGVKHQYEAQKMDEAEIEKRAREETMDWVEKTFSDRIMKSVMTATGAWQKYRESGQSLRESK